MAVNSYFSKDQIDKLGNLINFLASKIPHLYLTKLLKLLYIIDEQSVTETGVPVTWLKYLVWKKGPVASDIYYDITFRNGQSLSNYVKATFDGARKGFRIHPIGDFDDSEFSDYEMNLIGRVINQFGKLNSTQLIQYLHKEESLWTKICKEQGLNEIFEKTLTETSDVEIPLEERIKSDPYKMSVFNEVKESLSI